MTQIIGYFNGFPVNYDVDSEMASCKGVVFSLSDAISVSKGGSNLGTAKHVEHLHGYIKIDCLADTLQDFKQLIKTARNVKRSKSKRST